MKCAAIQIEHEHKKNPAGIEPAESLLFVGQMISGGRNQMLRQPKRGQLTHQIKIFDAISTRTSRCGKTTATPR
jgi:hypothetical protein